MGSTRRRRFRYVPPPTEMLDPDTGAGQPNFATATWPRPSTSPSTSSTGHLGSIGWSRRHDVGPGHQPSPVAGQIEGAVVQAHGYVISEDLQVSDGRDPQPRLSSYLIPGIGDIPTGSTA